MKGLSHLTIATIILSALSFNASAEEMERKYNKYLNFNVSEELSEEGRDFQNAYFAIVEACKIGALREEVCDLEKYPNSKELLEKDGRDKEFYKDLGGDYDY